MSRAEPQRFHAPIDRRPAIGQPLQRKEDARLLIGKGRFSDDFSLPGQTYAALVRSTHPHATFTVRADAAKAVPGVLGIFTGREALADGIAPLPHAPVPSTKYDMKLTAPDGTKNVFIGPHRLLPPDRTRFVGEAIVLVVGETMAAALDGAEAVAIDYADLPFVTETDRAATADASVWDEVPEGMGRDEYVITRYRETRQNLRTQLCRIIKRAGLKPWPKPWHNLRSTRQTELAEKYPIHVVCSWLGNSRAVAQAHYLQVTDAHFDQAVQKVADEVYVMRSGEVVEHGAKDEIFAAPRHPYTKELLASAPVLA